MSEFEWDPEKAEANREKHGISFEEAFELFDSNLPILERYDSEHSEDEDRYSSIGLILRGIVVVVWTERADEVVRIISARPATRPERELYREFAERWQA
ncbi:MAG: BrnT family toxin [Myxococcota bacterium]